MKNLQKAFTLVELLIAMAIVVVLVLFVSRIVASATNVASLGHKRMDCDEQARQLFARMSTDFAHMIKRSDLDAYVKGLDVESGNDFIAFFSEVPGYYSSSTAQSPVSLVSYRISNNKLERMGKGLLWNAASSADTSLIFGPSPLLQTTWPTAVNGAADADYEVIGPQVFRFEYFYVLKDGTVATSPGPSGMQNVAAISVCIAVTDPRSRGLLAGSLPSLANPSKMHDFDPSMSNGGLLVQWQSALDNATGAPRAAISAIRLYQRDFYLR